MHLWLHILMKLKENNLFLLFHPDPDNRIHTIFWELQKRGKQCTAVVRNCDKGCCNLVYITLGGLENPLRMMSRPAHPRQITTWGADRSHKWFVADLSGHKSWVLYRQDYHFWGFATSLCLRADNVQVLKLTQDWKCPKAENVSRWKCPWAENV